MNHDPCEGTACFDLLWITNGEDVQHRYLISAAVQADGFVVNKNFICPVCFEPGRPVVVDAWVDYYGYQVGGCLNCGGMYRYCLTEPKPFEVVLVDTELELLRDILFYDLRDSTRALRRSFLCERGADLNYSLKLYSNLIIDLAGLFSKIEDCLLAPRSSEHVYLKLGDGEFTALLSSLDHRVVSGCDQRIFFLRNRILNAVSRKGCCGREVCERC
jgi:hypothetical protein